MPSYYKKEWMEKSSIDYFSPFISLWLACNSCSSLTVVSDPPQKIPFCNKKCIRDWGYFDKFLKILSYHFQKDGANR